MTVRILVGDCRDVLRTLPDESVQCVVTSPPYYGLRDYGTAQWVGGDPACEHTYGNPKSAMTSTLSGSKRNCGNMLSGYRHICDKCGATRVDRQLGLERTPAEYVANLVGVFREVRRVLRGDGVLFLNLGDSYTGSGVHPGGSDKQQSNVGAVNTRLPAKGDTYLKPKDLIGIPWMVAFALQEDGWWLRSDIIWSKPNPMPESVTDRPTKAHEYIFLLTKAARYFFDAEAVRQENSETSQTGGMYIHPWKYEAIGHGRSTSQMRVGVPIPRNGRNIRSVWPIATHPYSEAHFAVFPPDIPERCIKAGTSERGCCPECGSPWVRCVERTSTNPWNERKKNGAGRGTLERGYNENHGEGMSHDLGMITTTTGWRPSCSHDAYPVPCVVLDPFAGAGTTLLVSDRLQRDAIGIELNAEYAAMAERRIATDAGPMCADVEVQNHSQLEMTI